MSWAEILFSFMWGTMTVFDFETIPVSAVPCMKCRPFLIAFEAVAVGDRFWGEQRFLFRREIEREDSAGNFRGEVGLWFPQDARRFPSTSNPFGHSRFRTVRKRCDVTVLHGIDVLRDVPAEHLATSHLM
jgi:hypothetical protein